MRQWGERRALELLGERHRASTALVSMVDADENDELASSFYSSTIRTDRVQPLDDRKDEERETEMLAKLLDKHGSVLAVEP